MCWFSDRDADYLELQSTTEDDIRIERQLLLSRREHFLVLADSISCESGAKLEYTSSLPLTEAVSAECDRMTREGILHADAMTVRLFPVGLAQDRVMSTNGGLTVENGPIQLQQTGIGGLHAPLVLDWHPDRQAEDADWNALTVTEDRQILTPDKAAGHRLRIGNHQLLIYRSLQATEESRAVLGQHMRHETLIGQFDTKGEMSPYVLVES